MTSLVFHSQSLFALNCTAVWGMNNDSCLYFYDGESENQTLSIYQHCSPTICVDIKYNNKLAHRIPFYTRENAFEAIKRLNVAVRTKSSQVDLRELQEDSVVNIEKLIERIDRNDADAMYLLAMRYLKGDEVEKDVYKAAQLFADSARLGSPEGQYTYGSLLQQGLGTDKNILDAIKWYNLAISQGEPHSMLNLSSIYLLERATIQKGIMLLRKAEHIGLAEAQVNWGVTVLLGAHGLQKNEEEAYQSFKNASRQLFPIGLFWFGWMHLGISPKYYSVEKAKFIWSIGTIISKDFISRLQKSLSTMDMFPGVDDARRIIYDLSHEDRSEFGEIDLSKIIFMLG